MTKKQFLWNNFWLLGIVFVPLLWCPQRWVMDMFFKILGSIWGEKYLKSKTANRNLRRKRGFTSKTFLYLNYLSLNHSKDNTEIVQNTKRIISILPVHNSKESGFLEEWGGKKVGWWERKVDEEQPWLIVIYEYVPNYWVVAGLF